MKKQNDLLQNATQLTEQEMKNVRGGISDKEYCEILHAILSNPDNVENMDPGARAGAGYAWALADCQRWYKDIAIIAEQS